MTTTISKTAKFLGVPLTVARNALLAWDEGKSKDIATISYRSDVREDVPTTLALLSEMEANGLIGKDPDYDYGHGFGLTTKGRGLAHASDTPRITKAKAKPILDQLLKNIEATKLIEGFPRKVTKVWLFGSMIDATKTDVGDVDVVVESEPTPEFSGSNWQNADKILRERFGKFISKTAMARDQFIDTIIMNEFVFGKKRNKLLAPNDKDMLEDLHVPCKLIYDSERNGPVDDPILPHLPSSKKRGDNIYPRAYLPSLERTGLLSNARFLSDGHFPVKTAKHYKQFFKYESAYGRIVTNLDDIAEMKEALRVPDQMVCDFSKVNGRDEFLIWFPEVSRTRTSGWPPRGWVSIKRAPSIESGTRGEKDGCFQINCSVTIQEIGEQGQFTETHMKWVNTALSTMLEADIKLAHERVLETKEDMSISTKTTVDVRTYAGRFLHGVLDFVTDDEMFSHVKIPVGRYSKTVEEAAPPIRRRLSISSRCR